MDCRKALVVALALGAGCVGCMSPAGQRAATGDGPGVEVSSGPKKPHASTEVAYADFRQREAADPKLTPSQREALWQQARVAYQNALKLDANYAPAYAGLAGLYVRMGDYDRALATYKQGLAKKPRDAGLWVDQGICQCRRQDWPAAVHSLQKAHDLDPENRFTTKTLGVALAGAGRHQDSLACLKQVMSEAQAHFDLARVLLYIGQQAQGKEQLLFALHIQPDLPGARELYARLNSTEGQAVGPLAGLTFATGDGAGRPGMLGAPR
jgi:tetratricopeptide (TPR) repeat protein